MFRRTSIPKIMIIMVLICISFSLAATECIDMLIFGNTDSETAHSVTAVNSTTGTGGLGQPYRKLLNYNPPRDYGGTVTFTIGVDPNKQNYLTLKMWGSDYPTTTDRHIDLYLFYNGNQQLGYRHECDLLPLDRCSAEGGRFTGRWVYNTYILPLSMTQGQASVTLMIQVWGYFWPYGSNWDACQNTLEEPSRGLYRLYTHTDPFFVPPEDEVQGSPQPLGPIRPAGPDTVLEMYQSEANSYVSSLLAKGASSLKTYEVLHLARVYEASWADRYHSTEVLDKVRDTIDYYVQQQNSGGDKNSLFGWRGHGELAEALMEVYDGLNSRGDLSEIVDLGSGSKTRRQAYAEFFEEGRAWRASDLRYFTNQVLYCTISAYASHKAAELLVPGTSGWTDSEALTVVKRAVGLLPWVYNRSMDYSYYSWNVPLPNPYGDYYVITSKGLSRELAYVAYYGAVSCFMAHLADLTGDLDVKNQAIKFVSARAPFYFLHNDNDGYRGLHVEAAIGTRHNAQIGRTSYEDETFEAAAVLQDPVSVKFAQLALEHNWPYSSYSYPPIPIDKVKRVNDYIIVASLPPSDYNLPMEPEQPDFVFTDEDNAVVAAKIGNIRFYTEMYWITPTISNICRVHYTTPIMDRIALVRLESEYTPRGINMTREDNPAFPDTSKTPPPGDLNLHSYHAGESLPLAQGVNSGRAEFYRLKYGPILIGMNCTDDKYFQYAPDGFTAGVDLVSGQFMTAPITVGPKSTVMFYVDYGTPLRQPENPNDVVNGLSYRAYQGTWTSLPNFDAMTPVRTGEVPNFDISNPPDNNNFGFVFEGYIDVPADGNYTFYTISDDGSKLYIGSTLVVNNDGLHSMQEVSGSIGLAAGKHAIKVAMFDNTGSEGLEVRWEGPGISKRLIPSSRLYHHPQSNVLTSADFESGMGEWTNVSGEDTHDWTRNFGETPSSDTGPPGGANGSTWYVYLETSLSDGGAYYEGNTAYLEGPEINGSDRTLSFYYHMYGADMGTLNVDVYHNGSWDQAIWSLSGQQQSSSGDPYEQAIVDLSPYAGPIKIRFRAVAAGGYRGDMAIDDIVVTDGTAPGFVYGDTTGDDIVDTADLAEFFEHWVKMDCDQAAYLDLNDDCVINFYEFSYLALNWLE